MIKINFYQPFSRAINNSLISLLTNSLVLLIIFNFSWLLMLFRLSFRLTEIKNLGKTIFNLETLLLMGNFAIIILVIGFVLTIKQFKLLFNKH